MSIKVRVIPRKNPRASEQPPRYFGVTRRVQLVSEKELAEQIALMCTVKAPDVRGVLTALEEAIVTNLIAGNSIHLGEIGILRNVIHSRGVHDAADWDASLIDSVRTQFIQRQGIRLKLDDPQVKIEKANYLQTPS